MKSPSRIVIASAILLSGVSLAAAAGMSKSTSTSSSMAKPTDQLSLSSSQQKTAWQDISGQAVKETAPAKFTAGIGHKVPNQLAIRPVPTNAAEQVPALRPYSYALLDSNKLLIVNPTDRKVAQVITQ
jgi:Flp pilus assembly protein TadD